MNNLGPLTPEYVAGLTDGEGCFELGVIRNMTGHRYGWTPRPRFSLCQFGALPILYALRDFFGCGTVHKQRGSNDPVGDVVIESRAAIQAYAIPILDTLPLRIKRQDYQIWREAVALLDKKSWRPAKIYLAYLSLRDEINPGRGRRRKVDTEELRQAVYTKEEARNVH